MIKIFSQQEDEWRNRKAKFLGNSAVSTLPQQRIHMQQQKNRENHMRLDTKTDRVKYGNES
jgi:hypothetical protein